MQGSLVVIAHGAGFDQSAAWRSLRSDQIRCIRVDSPTAMAPLAASVLVLDAGMLVQADIAQWRAASDAVVVAEEGVCAEADLIAGAGFRTQATLKLLRFACESWALHREHAGLGQVLSDKHGHLSQMAEIGVALSAEKDLKRLLSKILTEGQRLGGCDASSLYLLDKRNPDEPKLTVKFTQNSSMPSPFKERQLPLTESSIAGYVALTDTELNIADAYAIPPTAPYQFNDTFDSATGYRTVSLIAIPMTNSHHEVVGVLQFINRKLDPADRLTDPRLVPDQVLPFEEERADLLRALAGQAALALENRRLLDSIKELFEGFVQASVYAIEQRDPSTSGHSFRVADLCVQLAEALPLSTLARYRGRPMSEAEIRELRFAALLHDFGKVGVREHVLTKGKKLEAQTVENLRYRVALAKENLHSRTLQKILNVLDREGSIDPSARAQLLEDMHREHRRLDGYLRSIIEANEPSLLSEGCFEHLQEIRNTLARDCHGHMTGLLSEQEFCALSIRKGSLTESERLEIESHVTHTMSFLSLIPWTPDLQRIPAIAGAHHEKLDGSGYPDGLAADQIPLPSRIMAVCDIYDALVAADRPYKSAIPIDRALGILEEEARSGMLDSDIVDVFIASRSYEAVQLPHLSPEPGASPVYHHPCDFHHACDHEQDGHPGH